MRTLILLSLASASFADDVAPDFNKEVRPLLSDRCLACHGPDATHREAELRLDDRDSATKDRDGYAVVVPGKPDSSELMARITSDDEDLVMPPAHLAKALTPKEVDILRRWIATGAEYQAHWAYVPPDSTLAENPQPLHQQIDELIAARLQKEKLRPLPQADPVTLIRRITFDLTGLPPTPEDVAKFVRDPSDAAWEAVVDKLLASDANAERLAVYWLDLVRFADTVGYHGDQDHNISPYRDYVIDAFADNIPFDQFTREQLAGDLLPDSGIDQKIASGYNRLLQTTHEGGLQTKEYNAIYQADRVRNVSAVWMGATVGCAQCHDHKYDPYTAKDFYALGAFFADIDDERHFKSGSNSLPTNRPPELAVHSRRERQRIAALQAEIARREAALKVGEDAAAERSKLEALKKELAALTKATRKTMVSQPLETPRTVRLLPRGNWLDESGPVVMPAVPEFLGKVTEGTDRATRLDLANWLTDSKNGSGLLTARVFANRFWYLMFGNGISPVLDDFGGQGAPPEHPKLLDRLAVEFAADWNVRKLLKQIVLSKTYRRSSAWTAELKQVDPENHLYARQSSWRLPAEMIRDAALDVSDLLVHEIGGSSVKPYQPAGYFRHLNFPTRKYKADEDQRQWRRGLYVHWQRQFLHPMMKAFDAPSREECTAQRPRSNTPLAALTLLNDPTFVEASKGLAARILKEHATDNDAQKLNAAFQLVVSRPANEFEQDVLLDLLKTARADYKVRPDDAKQATAVGLADIPIGDAIELASWTTVARTLLNLDEAVTRN